MNDLNEQLLRQLVRQMKIINFWITLFGTIVVAAIIALGILIFQVVKVIEHTNEQLSGVTSQLKSSVDVKSDVCGGSGDVAAFLQARGICD
ncbi:MAG TPA: hypothetical protein VF597_00860 [Candidatus Saccharimonadales bacterium]|jgi:hypothetical protein